MASGATASAATAVAVFAIMVLSSLGHPQTTGPLCSRCGLQCTIDCVQKITTTCRTYCENPLAARQSCEKQVFQACTVSSCCNGNCSRDCISEARNGCQFVHDTTINCESCRAGVLQSCPASCNIQCNSNCVKKEDGS